MLLNVGMKFKKIIIPILLILVLVIFNKVFLTSFIKANSYFASQSLYNNETVQPQKLFDKTWKIISNDYYDSSLNNQNWSRWKNHYQGKIKTDEDARIAIETMIASLDEPYTRFLTPKDFEELTTSISSRIYGIGVNIYSNSGKIEIFNVIPSTPADFAQIKQGDIIIAIDGKETNGMNVSEVANLVRGPENSVVELTLLRGNKKIIKKIKRKEIVIKNVKSSILNNHIGYIQILSFMGTTTPNEFMEALENTKKTDSLIIDLRGNTGGPLIIAILVGRFGYRMKLVTYTTTSANMMLREIGLVLFLASVGIKAGANFMETVVQGDGLKYVYTGFLITIIPILIIGTIARLKFKFNYFTIMGMLAGTCTDPPALAYANSICSKEAPAIGYSTVYPLSMFLRIFTAQIVVLFFCGA